MPTARRVGDEFRVNTVTSDQQAEPIVAVDAAGNFTILWQSCNQDGSELGRLRAALCGRRHALGRRISGQYLYLRPAKTVWRRPTARAATCWWLGKVTEQDGSGTWGIYGQLYGTGLTQADLVPISTTAPSGANQGQMINVSATIRNQGGTATGPFNFRYYLSTDPVITPADTPLKRLDQHHQSGGCGTPSPTRGRFRCRLMRRSAIYYVGVLLDTNNEVTEADKTNNGTATAGFAQMDLRAPLPTIGGEFLVNSSTAWEQSTPSVDADAAGNYVVVWQSRYPRYPNYDIFLQRYNAQGTPIGYEQRVNTVAHGSQTNPVVAVADNGTFVVTWEGDDGSDRGVFMRQFNADGSPASDVVQVNTFTVWRAEPAASRHESRDRRFRGHLDQCESGRFRLTASTLSGSRPTARLKGASSASTPTRPTTNPTRGWRWTRPATSS